MLLIVLAVVGDLALRRTTIWAATSSAVGGNEEIARLVGVNTDRYKISWPSCSWAASPPWPGCWSWPSSLRGSRRSARAGSSTVIAGVVIGGVSLFGGIGSVAAGFVGMVLLQVVQSGLVVVGVNPNWQTVAVGVIMVLAVALDIFRRRVSHAGMSPKLRRPPRRGDAPASRPERRGEHVWWDPRRRVR